MHCIQMSQHFAVSLATILAVLVSAVVGVSTSVVVSISVVASVVVVVREQAIDESLFSMVLQIIVFKSSFPSQVGSS